MILFKYCTMDAIGLLEEQSFKITPIDQFADPREFLIESSGSIVGYLKSALLTEESISEKYRALLEINPDLNYDVFREKQLELLTDEKWVQRQISLINQMRLNGLEQFLRWAGSIGGTTSFSHKKSNFKLWSQYAGGHTGFMVSFNLQTTKAATLYKVKYYKKPTVLLINKIYGVQYREERLANMMQRKDQFFAYEKEYRLFVSQTECHINEQQWLFYFHPEIIKAVYIGYKCTPEHQSQILAILDKEEYQHIAIYKAARSENGRGVNYTFLKQAL